MTSPLSFFSYSPVLSKVLAHVLTNGILDRYPTLVHYLSDVLSDLSDFQADSGGRLDLCLDSSQNQSEQPDWVPLLLQLNTSVVHSDLEGNQDTVVGEASNFTFGSNVDVDSELDFGPALILALAQLREQLGQDVLKQFETFCYAQYLMMARCDNWGDMGKAQIQMSFQYIVLGLEPGGRLTSAHHRQFQQRLEEKARAYQLDNLSAFELKSMVESFVFRFFGATFDFNHIRVLDRFLRFCGLPFYTQGGFYGHEKEMIIGQGSHYYKGDYEVIELDKELFRTPNTIIPMAAAIGDRQVFIRYEALAMIYYQKWDPYVLSRSGTPSNPSGLDAASERRYHLHQQDLYRLYAGDPDGQIGHWFKMVTGRYYDQHYGAYSSEVVQKKMISDIALNVTAHELGHAVIQYELLDPLYAPLSEACRLFGETIVTTLLEVLAELAPLSRELEGPLSQMVRISKQDPRHASRLFFMYCSDTWFFDTSETYMYLYSELMALILSACIEPDASVNFDRLHRFVSGSDSLVFWVVAQLDAFLTDLFELVSSELYVYEGDSLSLPDLQKRLGSLDSSPYFDTASVYMKRVHEWTEFFLFLQKTDASLVTIITSRIAEFESEFKAAFFEKVRLMSAFSDTLDKVYAMDSRDPLDELDEVAIVDANLSSLSKDVDIRAFVSNRLVGII